MDGKLKYPQGIANITLMGMDVYHMGGGDRDIEFITDDPGKVQCCICCLRIQLRLKQEHSCQGQY